MLPDNWESSSDKCFIGPQLIDAIVQSEGWTYKDEGSSHRPKLGFISDVPGAQLKIKINTMSSSGNNVMPVCFYLMKHLRLL